MEKWILCPEPRRMDFQSGFYHLSDDEAGQVWNFTVGESLPRGFRFRQDRGNGLPDWYRLETGAQGVVISAASEKTVIIALQTVRQILSATGGLLPRGTIEDWADFAVRAVMIDISRDRVPTLDTLKKLIDHFSSWKYNQLQLYTEHTFAYRGHEEVWKEASPFTPEEISLIVAYSEERGMEVVPNQNSFGHMERWLKHGPYHHLAESPGGFEDPWGVFRPESSTLSPVVPEALEFLEGLYDQILPLYHSDFLNVGGDEPWELGKGRSRLACENRGLDRVYFDFILKLHALAQKKGKKIQIYGDIIMNYPDLVKELPRDLVLVNWGYEKDHPFEKECPLLAEAGLPFYVCVGTSAWNSLGGRWGNARANILKGAREGKINGASGFMISEWGDNGHWQQFPVALPGFLLGAAAAWNPGAAESFDSVGQLACHVFDGDRGMAEAVLLLGEVWEKSNRALHNVSLPFLLLADPVYPYYRRDYPHFRNHRFDGEEELLNQAQALIDGSEKKDPLSAAEIQFTLDLLSHACRLGRLQMATPDLLIRQIAGGERKQLHSELELLMERYQKLWLLRSRPGGLKDSLGRLEQLRDSYLS